MAPRVLMLIGFLIVLLAIIPFVASRNKGKNYYPDYYTFFILGICWLPLGIVMKNYLFAIVGVVFMIIGLSNKDKWKNNHKIWDKLSEKERHSKSRIIAVLSLLVSLGFIIFFIQYFGIN